MSLLDWPLWAWETWSSQAIRVMQDQPAGHVFNMDGAGADGNATPRMAAYGASKRSLVRQCSRDV